MQNYYTHINKTIAYVCRLLLLIAAIFLTSCEKNGSFVLISGEKHSLDDFRGQFVVVNFWAEWCAPCLEEVPELNRLHRQNTEVSVIGISFDPIANHDIQSISRRWEIKYPLIASQPVPILPFGLPKQLPTNYLISPSGEVVQILVGKQSQASIEAAIASYKERSL